MIHVAPLAEWWQLEAAHDAVAAFLRAHCPGYVLRECQARRVKVEVLRLYPCTVGMPRGGSRSFSHRSLSPTLLSR